MPDQVERTEEGSTERAVQGVDKLLQPSMFGFQRVSGPGDQTGSMIRGRA